jgi:hypothetical protein
LPWFQQVSRDEFDRILEKSKASSTFREQFARYEPQYYEGANGPDCMVHLGPLKMTGHFEAPAFYTLVTGDLHVDGVVDLHNRYDKGFDEGGLFVALGDVVCHSFFNEYGKCTFVDGRLEARDLLVNSFEDSALVVIRSLKTNFFFGGSVGGGRRQRDHGIRLRLLPADRLCRFRGRATPAEAWPRTFAFAAQPRKNERAAPERFPGTRADRRAIAEASVILDAEVAAGLV